MFVAVGLGSESSLVDPSIPHYCVPIHSEYDEQCHSSYVSRRGTYVSRHMFPYVSRRGTCCGVAFGEAQARSGLGLGPVQATRILSHWHRSHCPVSHVVLAPKHQLGVGLGSRVRCFAVLITLGFVLLQMSQG